MRKEHLRVGIKYCNCATFPWPLPSGDPKIYTRESIQLRAKLLSGQQKKGPKTLSCDETPEIFGVNFLRFFSAKTNNPLNLEGDKMGQVARKTQLFWITRFLL